MGLDVSMYLCGCVGVGVRACVRVDNERMVPR